MNTSARSIISVFLFLLLVTPVFAQSARPRNEKARVSVMAEEKMGMTSEKLRSMVERMFVRLEMRLENYEDFLSRIRTRRDKLAGAGKNVVKIDAFILTAGDNLSKARTILAAAKLSALELEYTGNRSEYMRAVRAEITEVREAMTTLHTSMSQTVRELKTADVSTDVEE